MDLSPLTCLLSEIDPRKTEVIWDESWIDVCPHYSTQWDSFAHIGYQFDAVGDGEPENMCYNGHHLFRDLIRQAALRRGRGP